MWLARTTRGWSRLFSRSSLCLTWRSKTTDRAPAGLFRLQSRKLSIWASACCFSVAGDTPFIIPGPASRPMASANVNLRPSRISRSSPASASPACRVAAPAAVDAECNASRAGGAIRRRRTERCLQLATHLHGKIILIQGDVVPREALAFRNVALEPHVVSEAERKQRLAQRALGRQLPAPDAVAPLSVDHLAALERALGGRDHVRAEIARRAGRLAAQRHACNRHAELQANHVDWPVERRKASAAVRQHGVFLEAAPGIVALALEHDVGAERQMMGNVTPVAIDRGDDFGHPRGFENPARRFRLADIGELEPACRRKTQAARLRRKSGGIADRGHLDCRFGAVNE